MFLDNRKEANVLTYASCRSRYTEPARYAYVRLMSSGFPDVKYEGGKWHDIQVRVEGFSLETSNERETQIVQESLP